MAIAFNDLLCYTDKRYSFKAFKQPRAYTLKVNSLERSLIILSFSARKSSRPVNNNQARLSIHFRANYIVAVSR
jgi:hypothetical protein